jgi:hypothetical protein
VTETGDRVWVALVHNEDGAWVAAVSRDPSDAKDEAQAAADPNNEHEWTWQDGDQGDQATTPTDPATTLCVQEATIR